ncbi:MAG TPA: GvpL/GvpF family gas vesicle protein, partial [Candidatus Limnocylindria bacterium]|nr:GvpL/GvpF family gas vesicle protein [Candidatus Limnocylindria bacterium]
RAATLAATLATIGERVELTATLAWRVPRTRPDAREARDGRAYLAARATREREQREAEQVVARLIEQLPCERAFVRQRICPREGIAAIVAVLSTRDEVELVRRDLTAFADRSSEVSAAVYGPFPPYSFTS